MRFSSETGEVSLSATDLANHLACRHLTNLELALAQGKIGAPRQYGSDAERIEALQQRGNEHESAYIQHLQSESRGLNIVKFDFSNGSHSDTVGAMRNGAGIIVQSALESRGWVGRADILRRVTRPSSLGAWSYEVIDTKLARETKAGTVLQICLYSDIVSEIQGVVPENMYVVTPGREENEPFVEERYRVNDYLAYYRLMRRRLASAVDAGAEIPIPSSYPESVPNCDICRWQLECEDQWRKDDHLTFVAGMPTSQRREVDDWDVATLEKYAEVPTPLQRNPKRGARESYERTINQARIQLEGRRKDAPIYEILEIEPERGLALLPEPSPGDVFFDIEGDPFVGSRGFEYLFGWCLLDSGAKVRYQSQWALGTGENSPNLYDLEKSMFEAFVDLVISRWTKYPEMHIYHFGGYETGALKRVMGRYGIRESQIDNMLRAHLFVDLHTVVRQSIRASVERYSIKDLEPFFGYERDIDLRQANSNRHRLELFLETGRIDEVSDEMRRVVELYNRDDCASLIRLRNWLEEHRADLISRGRAIERPTVSMVDAVDEERDDAAALKDALLADVTVDRNERTAEQHARWLMAHMLRWHKREANTQWWEKFRLADLDAKDLFDERAGISGLRFLERVVGHGVSQIHRYRYGNQETSAKPGDSLRQVGGDDLGKIVDINYRARTVDINKASAVTELHPRAAFVFDDPYRTPTQQGALFSLASWVAENGIDAPGEYRAGRDLLLSRGPRLNTMPDIREPLQRQSETTLDTARRLVLQLDGGVLAIQGPPGTGKTYTGARLICELVRAGKKVGITANSHKVIRNLLDMAVEAASEEDVDIKIIQKVSGKPNREPADPIQETNTNNTVLTQLAMGTANVAAATAWLWSRTEFNETVDVLIVDEAGQMSLANALAISQGAKNLVLLGDPQQLQQPQQASHPDGTEVSALEHLLGGSKTIPDDRGIFIAETRRLHPSICNFTSELFYDNRLVARPELSNQAVVDSESLVGTGLWFADVEHDGNQSASVEEADRVAEIFNDLISSGACWIDEHRTKKPLTTGDVLIVVPYNAHLGEIRRRLPDSRVGTVDMFQGQEAPIVIYSMASSSTEDAPRGMDFLYDLNRLNVATSRARCACIIVASQRLFEPECRTPKQMRLANALCRYREMAQTI